MKPNISAFDGWFRTLLFIVALSYAIIAGTLAAWLFVIVGAVLFATAILAWCPLYEIFGVNTDKK